MESGGVLQKDEGLVPLEGSVCITLEDRSL